MPSPADQFIVINFRFPIQLSVAVFKINTLTSSRNGNHAHCWHFRNSCICSPHCLATQVSSKNWFFIPRSPESHGLAIASLLTFCLGCDSDQYLSSTNRSSTLATLLHHVLAWFQFISFFSLCHFLNIHNLNSSLIVYLIFPWVLFS